jgi:hypothetical protein
MKQTLLTTALLITTVLAYAQVVFPIDSASGQIRYERIVAVENTSKDLLYERANVWLAKAFVDSKEVIQYSNQETGKVLAKGRLELNATYNGYEQSMGVVRFTLEVNTKEGRVRVLISDLIHEFTDGNPSPGDLRKEKSYPIMKKAWRVVKSETDNDIRSLIDSFEKAVSEVPKEDDW